MNKIPKEQHWNISKCCHIHRGGCYLEYAMKIFHGNAALPFCWMVPEKICWFRHINLALRKFDDTWYYDGIRNCRHNTILRTKHCQRLCKHKQTSTCTHVYLSSSYQNHGRKCRLHPIYTNIYIELVLKAGKIMSCS